MGVGVDTARVDAFDKVTGRAKFTDDLCPKPCLEARVLHATIGNGFVKSMDVSDAEKVPGVVAVYTCFDVPDRPYATAGHPLALEPERQDIADRKMLDARVRMYGDNIAVVVGENDVACSRALREIRVEYEEYPVRLSAESAIGATGNGVLHEDFPDNILGHPKDETSVKGSAYESVDDILSDPTLGHARIHAWTPRQSHVHLEPCVSFCYGEGERLVCVASTQIPHVLRRIIAQALDIPVGMVRVIKPCVGGGFGNKQDVHYEPLNAWICQQLGGRCVKLELTREEVFFATRSRQPKEFFVEAAYDDEKNLKARSLKVYSNQGAYASHGNAVIGDTLASFRQVYDTQELASRVEAISFFSNESTAGAMRGYGVPEGIWAAECLMGDIAYDNGWDGVEFRLKNAMKKGYRDPFFPDVDICHSNALSECVEKGKQYIGWDEKKHLYVGQAGPVRRGVGVSFFSYLTGVVPFLLETASARMVLNQDGSVMVQLGATEIGQGADTALSQIAAEAIGIDVEKVHLVSTQDTDTSPYDSGAYASRQTYVSGTAVKKVGEELRAAILAYASEMLPDVHGLDLREGKIVNMRGDTLLSLEDVAKTSYYSMSHPQQIAAVDTVHVKTNTFALGCAFVDLTVDIPLCQVTINDAVEVLDSGRLINPKCAEQQVHGGMAQSLAMALSEELLTDKQTGRMLNPNLLDYKIPTMMDLPDLRAGFVESNDPTGPYGNKALGECPCIPAAPAVRDALLDATGVKFYEAPMTPQRLFEGFKREGLLS